MEILIRKGNQIKVATDNLYCYPPFEALLNSYGKNEDALDKVIKYIYFTCSPEALPQVKGYTTKETHKYACLQSGLKEDFKPDATIKDAQRFYLANCTNEITEYMYTVASTLRTSDKICRALKNRFNEYDFENLNNEQIASISSGIKEVLSLSSKINEQVPTILKNIELLKLQKDKEVKGIELQRGGSEIPDSYEQTNEDIQ
jgi:hypothetical protein